VLKQRLTSCLCKVESKHQTISGKFGGAQKKRRKKKRGVRDSDSKNRGEKREVEIGDATIKHCKKGGVPVKEKIKTSGTGLHMSSQKRQEEKRGNPNKWFEGGRVKLFPEGKGRFIEPRH